MAAAIGGQHALSVIADFVKRIEPEPWEPGPRVRQFRLHEPVGCLRPVSLACQFSHGHVDYLSDVPGLQRFDRRDIALLRCHGKDIDLSGLAGATDLVVHVPGSSSTLVRGAEKAVVHGGGRV